MTSPSVSVVVPVRNAAPYLGDCLESLLAQSEPGLEIVVVDDGSTDGSAELADSFRASAPERIRLFRQPALGQGAARNLGVRVARGRFLGTVDGDDRADAGMFAALRERAEATGAEIVVGNGTMFDHFSGATTPFQDGAVWRELARLEPSLVFAPRTTPDLFLLDASACRRLYRLDLLRRCAPVFPEGLLFDDVFAHFRLLLAAERVALLDRDLYRYRIGHPGRVTDRRDAALLDIVAVLRLVAEELDRASATPEIWASFLRFQGWALRWLGNQIEPALSLAFARAAVDLAHAFPAESVASFRHRHRDDRGARTALALQLDGRVRLYRSLLRGAPSRRAARALAALYAAPD